MGEATTTTPIEDPGGPWPWRGKDSGGGGGGTCWSWWWWWWRWWLTAHRILRRGPNWYAPSDNRSGVSSNQPANQTCHVFTYRCFLKALMINSLPTVFQYQAWLKMQSPQHIFTLVLYPTCGATKWNSHYTLTILLQSCSFSCVNCKCKFHISHIHTSIFLLSVNTELRIQPPHLTDDPSIFLLSVIT